jgi:predicted PurR-regulated permease PerM
VFYGIYQLSGPASEWIERAPDTVKDIEYKLQKFMKPVEEVSKATKQAEALTKIEKEGKAQTITIEEPSFMKILLGQTWEFIIGLALVIILLYFLLASGDLFLFKLIKVLPRLEDKKRTIEIARQTESDISLYLITVTIINVILGAFIGLAMLLLGMPNPILWGVMAGFLNFIPYLGAIVGISVVGLVALTTFENLGHCFLVPASYFVINALEGNFVTPMMLGRRLALNPVVIFISLIFWSWLWGIPGALIAVPITAVFKIICDHIEPLAPIGEFLGK